MKRLLLLAVLVVVLFAGAAAASQNQCADTNLVLCYPFNDTTATDYSGEENDGLLQGNITTETSAIFDQSFTFDGNGDFVYTSQSPELDMDETATFAAWIKPDSTQTATFHPFVDQAKVGYQTFYHSNGSMVFKIVDSGNNNNFVWSDAIPVEEWTHVAMVYDGSTAKIYLNGTLNKTDSFSVSVEDGIDEVYTGGYNGTSEYFSGELDEVRVYSDNLSSAEVSNLKTSNSRESPSNISVTCEANTTDYDAINCSFDPLANNQFTEVYIDNHLVDNTTVNTTNIQRLLPNAQFTVTAQYTNSTDTSNTSTTVTTKNFDYPDTPALDDAEISATRVKDGDILTDFNHNATVVNGSIWAATSIYNNSNWFIGLWRTQNSDPENWTFHSKVPNMQETGDGFRAPQFFINESSGTYYLLADNGTGTDTFEGWIEKASSIDSLNWSEAVKFFDHTQTNIGKRAIDYDMVWNGTEWMVTYGGAACDNDEYGLADTADTDVTSGWTEYATPTIASFCEGMQPTDGFKFTDNYLAFHIEAPNPDDTWGVAEFTSRDLSTTDNLIDNWLGTGANGKWDERGRGHGDVAWYNDTLLVIYQGFNSTGDNTGSTVVASDNFMIPEATDTTPPTITIHNPNNQTYTTSSVALDVTADETVDTWQYSLDGGSNVTFTPNTTLSGLSEGGHTVTVYANDSLGNTGSNSASFTVDFPPRWRNLQDNVTGGYAERNDIINISSEWRDDSPGFQNFLLATNETGSFVNTTELFADDDFEDGTYTDNWDVTTNNGDTAVQQSIVKNGQNSLNITADTTGSQIITHNRTSNDKIRDGDVYQFWVNRDTDTQAIYYSIADSKSGPSGVNVWFPYDGSGIPSDTIYLRTEDSVEKEVYANFQQDTWYKIELEFDLPNTVIIRVYDSSESLLASDSGSITTDYSRQYVNLEVNENNASRTTGSSYFDDVTYGTPESRENISGRWVTRSELFQNSTFLGTLGYKMYGEDGNGNWNVTDVGSFFVNADPLQKNASVTWENIGGSVTKQVLFGYDDENTNDIQTVTAPTAGLGTQTSSNTTSKVNGWTSPFDWAAKVTDFQGVSSPVREINFTTYDTGNREDDFSHTLSTQQWNRTVSIYNRGDQLTNTSVTLANDGSVVQTGEIGGSIGTGVNQTTTEVWQGDQISQTEHDFSPQNDPVTLGVNYIGDRNLELVNGKSFQWTGIDTTGGVTVPNQCSQTNNTAVDLGGGATTNYTVEFDCSPGVVNQTNLSETADATANNESKFNYTGKMYIYSAETETVEVEWRIDKDELSSFSARNNASGYFKGANSNVSVRETSNFAYVTFGTDVDTSSPSASDDPHSVSLVYYVGSENTTDGGGGGGGTPDRETTVRFENTNFTVAPGTNFTDTFNIQNYANETNTVQITRQGGDCRYVTVQRTLNSDQYGSGGTYQVPPQTATGAFQQYAQESPQVRIQMPQNVSENLDDGEINCQFTVVATTGVAEPLTINAQPGIPILQRIRQVIDNLLGGFLDWYTQNIGPIFDGTICVRPIDAITGDAECEQSVPRPTPYALPLFATLLLTLYTGNRVRKGQDVIPGG